MVKNVKCGFISTAQTVLHFRFYIWFDKLLSNVSKKNHDISMIVSIEYIIVLFIGVRVSKIWTSTRSYPYDNKPNVPGLTLIL